MWHPLASQVCGLSNVTSSPLFSPSDASVIQEVYHTLPPTDTQGLFHLPNCLVPGTSISHPSPSPGLEDRRGSRSLRATGCFRGSSNPALHLDPTVRIGGLIGHNISGFPNVWDVWIGSSREVLFVVVRMNSHAQALRSEISYCFLNQPREYLVRISISSWVWYTYGMNVAQFYSALAVSRLFGVPLSQAFYPKRGPQALSIEGC